MAYKIRHRVIKVKGSAMSLIVGYARTSTVEQDAGLEAQIRDLKAAGCSVVFSEKVSSVAPSDLLPDKESKKGQRRDRFDAALAAVGPGDVIVVTKPDRLARSTEDLLRIVAHLNQRNVGLVILAMGGERVDTRSPTSKLILTILAAVAAWEVEINKERQREGIVKARAEGKYKGRCRATDRASYADRVYSLLDSGKLQHEVAAEMGIGVAQVKRCVKDRKLRVAAGLPSVAPGSASQPIALS